jgi:hypothetical protein
MNYVLNTLKAEIKNIRLYLEYCKGRVAAEGIEESTATKYRKEIKTNVRRIQQIRDAINLLQK